MRKLRIDAMAVARWAVGVQQLQARRGWEGGELSEDAPGRSSCRWPVHGGESIGLRSPSPGSAGVAFILELCSRARNGRPLHLPRHVRRAASRMVRVVFAGKPRASLAGAVARKLIAQSAKGGSCRRIQ